MPLRDHFHPPLNQRHSWDALFGGWPAMIVSQLHRFLPLEYYAAPFIRLGRAVDLEPKIITRDDHVDLLDNDEYSVRIYDQKDEPRLVASIELISPANKDRPESRRVFASKCAALIRENVSVILIDVVTSHPGDLSIDLLHMLYTYDRADTQPTSNMYVTSLGLNFPGQPRHRKYWSEPLFLGKPFPKIPLWLPDSMWHLELEVSYEETCRILRMS